MKNFDGSVQGGGYRGISDPLTSPPARSYHIRDGKLTFKQPVDAHPNGQVLSQGELHIQFGNA